MFFTAIAAHENAMHFPKKHMNLLFHCFVDNSEPCPEYYSLSLLVSDKGANKTKRTRVT